MVKCHYLAYSPVQFFCRWRQQQQHGCSSSGSSMAIASRSSSRSRSSRRSSSSSRSRGSSRSSSAMAIGEGVCWGSSSGGGREVAEDCAAGGARGAKY